MMSDAPCPLYIFRSANFAPSGNTVVTIAPIDRVAAVYGGEGGGGLSDAFGGVAIFLNDATGERFAGVWGARNASRFRRKMRESIPVVLRRETPAVRLALWSAYGKRPARIR
ncbi:hypothetical protein GB928_014360 [Shinella curvata]|uniref:Uncharacterized protein n=1 Tax=Shinella curvata TaxID=1817964 RepID=A0ABT8XFG1_9HYPH|nr:hypothetical protein [Shinella curvata]MCJ8053041.1 hypothetical protein [Shinella curvata]MDO6122372.1 hypothetical protein [Shinella curvata]